MFNIVDTAVACEPVLLCVVCDWVTIMFTMWSYVETIQQIYRIDFCTCNILMQGHMIRFWHNGCYCSEVIVIYVLSVVDVIGYIHDLKTTFSLMKSNSKQYEA